MLLCKTVYRNRKSDTLNFIVNWYIPLPKIMSVSREQIHEFFKLKCHYGTNDIPEFLTLGDKD